MDRITARVGDVLIGGGNPIVPQSMCNTHTYDVAGTVAQCRRMYEAGAVLTRITVPGLNDIPHLKAIRDSLRSEGISMPLVADIHFSSATAIAAASIVEKVRINPGNFHKDHEKACSELSRLVKVCRDNGTAIRIGLNHGSLGERITNLYGNTSFAMAKAAMEWLELCLENDFRNVVVSLKASNTIVMTRAYIALQEMMEASGTVFPMHVGVTEAGGGDSGRIKSYAGISSVLSEGIGDTVRVSLTEPPENELPCASYLSDRYSSSLRSSLVSMTAKDGRVDAVYNAPSRERLLADLSCDFGKRLINKDIDEVTFHGTYLSEDGVPVEIDDGFSRYLSDELLQACRRKFYRPEYIACPGCGRTMYDLQGTLKAVMERTRDLKDVCIAVMGCIVNGPGEMADADWGYVGEGNGKVSIYKGPVPVMTHIPENEAVDRLAELISAELPKESAENGQD